MKTIEPLTERPAYADAWDRLQKLNARRDAITRRIEGAIQAEAETPINRHRMAVEYMAAHGRPPEEKDLPSSPVLDLRREQRAIKEATAIVRKELDLAERAESLEASKAVFPQHRKAVLKMASAWRSFVDALGEVEQIEAAICDNGYMIYEPIVRFHIPAKDQVKHGISVLETELKSSNYLEQKES